MSSQLNEKMWYETRELPGLGLRCGAGTLSGWRRYCPLLGENLRTKPHPTDLRKILWFGPQIRRIVELLKPLPDEFEHEGLSWIWAQRVEGKYGVAPSLLRRIWNGRGLAAPKNQLARMTRLGSTDGRNVHQRVYYRVDQTEEVAAAYGEAVRVGRSTTAVFVDRSVRWCPVPWLETEEAAAAGLHFRRHSVSTWSLGHCPWLGKRLSVRRMLAKLPDGRLAWVNFHLESELLEIKRLQRNPPHPDLVGQAEAKRDYRVSQARLATNCRRDNPQLHNQRLSPILALLPTRSYGQTVTLKRRRGYPIANLVVLRDRPPVAPPDPALWVSRKAAAREAGLSNRTISVWRVEGFPGPNRKRLRLRSQTFLVQVGGPHGTRLMNVVHLNRPDLDAILALRATAETWESLYTDSEGTWCRPLYLRKVYGWHRPRLAQFRKACAQLGRPITAKLIPRPTGAGGQPLGWGHLKHDVERLATALKGGILAPGCVDHVGNRGAAALAPQPAVDAMPKHPVAQVKTRRGRKPDTDADQDRRMAEAWETGVYKNKAALGLAFNKTERDVILALDRDRKRRRTTV